MTQPSLQEHYGFKNDCDILKEIFEAASRDGNCKVGQTTHGWWDGTLGSNRYYQLYITFIDAPQPTYKGIDTIREPKYRKGFSGSSGHSGSSGGHDVVGSSTSHHTTIVSHHTTVVSPQSHVTVHHGTHSGFNFFNLILGGLILYVIRESVMMAETQRSRAETQLHTPIGTCLLELGSATNSMLNRSFRKNMVNFIEKKTQKTFSVYFQKIEHMLICSFATILFAKQIFATIFATKSTCGVFCECVASNRRL